MCGGIDTIKEIKQEIYPNDTQVVNQDKTLRGITQAHYILTHQTAQPQKENSISLFNHERKILKTALNGYAVEGMNTVQYQIYQYALKLMRDTCTINDIDTINNHFQETKQNIAKIVFLANKDPIKTLYLLQTAQPLQAIENEVKTQIAAIIKHLEEVVAIHTKVGLQSPNQAYFVAFHLEIFKALVLPEGKFNVELIPLLLQELFDDKSLDVDWKKQTKGILEKIQNSIAVQTKVATIKKPSDENTLAQNLIRLTLDIHPDKKISDLHAQIVGLAGMVPIRQGPVGNCFVICNALWFVTTVLEKTLTDFSQILDKGEVVRMEGDQKMEYPIDFDIADKDLDRPFKIDESGKLEGGAYLWESPGIQSACYQLGLEDITAIKTVIQSLFIKEKELEITPRNFLKELAKLSSLKARGDLEQLACLAFSSKTNMPLVHAWTSALAAIDQTLQTSSLHEKLNTCWKNTFSPLWKDLSKIDQIVKKIEDIFHKQISERMVIEYDESVQTPLAGDGSSTAGSYVYYEKDLWIPATAAYPIHTYVDLTQFALHSLQSTQKQITTEGLIQLNQYQLIASKIENFINEGDKFADRVLSNYDTSFKDLPTLEKKWEAFKAYGEIGGDNINVFKHAMGFPLPPPIKASQATARERLVTIIQFLRDREKIDHFTNSPQEERYEMDSDDHAFSLPTDNRTLLPFVTSEEAIDQMIQKHIFLPCQAVSQAPIIFEQKNKLMETASRLVPKELTEKFAALSQQMQEKTIHEYTKAIFDLIVKLNPGMDKTAKSTLLAKFSNIVLYKVLDPEQFKIIEGSTVLGPDTNWVDDNLQRKKLLAIFFAFTLNVVTNSIEFFEIDEDSSNLYALSQVDWIDGPWNIYGLNLESTNIS